MVADEDTSAAAASKSALQDNLERKGKNAYYFAHAHKATGPQWDGKPEPKLLSKSSSIASSSSSSSAILPTQPPKAFDYAKSNITTYAFLDDGPKVKLYVELPGVGDQCTDADVELESTVRSLSLVVHRYTPGLVAADGTATSTSATTNTPHTLCFGRLTADISKATARIKANRILVTLVKVDADVQWHTMNDKGAPDHEVV